MDTTPPTLTISSVAAISNVAAADWDSCAGADNPFVRHAFLLALEESGSVGGGTGWVPNHLTARNEAGRIVGCVPAYLKAHSYGEYVFDHGWAEAWERAGGQYYPKLLGAVPFTPAPGPRLLIHAEADRASVAQALARGMRAMVDRSGLSSAHVTFADGPDAAVLAADGWLTRIGTQFHWQNNGYTGFDDFLGALASRKRKALRKEREAVAASDVELVTLTGGDLTRDAWDAFFAFYQSTSDRKWGYPYLTRGFFDRLGATMADAVVLVMARQGGVWIAGALNLRGKDTLYGRNWGCAVDVPFLHFEACYYRAIDFAIAHGLTRVEAGAQGPHKIQRGYLPVETTSLHYIADAGFRRAVGDFLRRETAQMRSQIAALAEDSPYRREGND